MVFTQPLSTGIANRVRKSGYSLYKETDSKEFPEGYALIVDGSMAVGSEKLLLEKVFHFIGNYKLIINELKDIFITVNPILKRLKNEGLSETTVHKTLSEIKSLTAASSERVVAVGRLMEKYITAEYGKLSGQIFFLTGESVSSVKLSNFNRLKNRR